MRAAVDDLTHAIKTFDRAIAGVVKHPPGPARWRAANDLWLSLSFKNQRVYKEVIADNKLTRDQVNKFGMAIGNTKQQKADQSLRNCLNIPVGAYLAIGKSDPTAFTLKENSKKMFNTFPEYATREVW